MSSLRDIKRRIANVGTTQQMVKAMYMIASTKLHKARAQLEGVRPIYRELSRVVRELARQGKARKHVFYRGREVRSSLYIVLTSDRGFSGSYSAGIMTRALEHMEEKNEKILVVGSKGHQFFKKRGKNIIGTIINLPDAQVYYGSESIAHWAIDLYLAGEVDEVFIVYTRFETLLSYVPCVDRLLPVDISGVEVDDHEHIKYEPDVNTFIDNVIPLYMHMSLFRAFSESHTSEEAARMVSMDTAEKNADDMIRKLTRMYNRRRQAAITQEINEIVGSATMLNVED
ncbi:MAG TPA: ATP synthase F1 subunit gamma [Firmicutes bacterium]|nr:ATP synthase F1 subunit gamma [Bacillota bacterium]